MKPRHWMRKPLYPYEKTAHGAKFFILLGYYFSRFFGKEKNEVGAFQRNDVNGCPQTPRRQGEWYGLLTLKKTRIETKGLLPHKIRMVWCL